MKLGKLRVVLSALVVLVATSTCVAQAALASEAKVTDTGIVVSQHLDYTNAKKNIPVKFNYEVKPLTQGSPSIKGMTLNGGLYTFDMVGVDDTQILEFECGGVATGKYQYQLKQVLVDIPDGMTLDPTVYLVDVYVKNSGKCQCVMYKASDKDAIDKADEASNQFKLEGITWTVKYKAEPTPSESNSKIPNLPGGIFSKTGDLLYNVIPAAGIALLVGIGFIVVGKKKKQDK